MHKRFLWITVLLGVTLLLFACTPTEEPLTNGLPVVTITSEGSLPPNGNPNDEPITEPIEDRKWILTAIVVNGIDIPLDATTTLTLGEDGRISGNGGCNSYFGSYIYDNHTGMITFKDIGMTEMGCATGMEQELIYYQSLIRVVKVSLAAGNLQFSTNDGRTNLTFMEEPMMIPLPSLEKTMWSLNTIGKGEVASSLLAGTAITLQLNSDGSFAGNSGCNDYNGVYTLEGTDGITLQVRGITRRACPEGVDQQESHYVQTLDTITHYTLDMAGLTLYTADESYFFQFNSQ